MTAVPTVVDPEQATVLTLLERPETARPAVTANGASRRTLRRRCLNWHGLPGIDLTQRVSYVRDPFGTLLAVASALIG